MADPNPLWWSMPGSKFEVTPARVAMWADLLASPTREVPDEDA